MSESERAGGGQLVGAAEIGDHTLAHGRAVARVLDDLHVSRGCRSRLIPSQTCLSPQRKRRSNSASAGGRSAGELSKAKRSRPSSCSHAPPSPKRLRHKWPKKTGPALATLAP